MEEKIEKALKETNADRWYVHLIANRSSLRVVDVISYIVRPGSGYALKQDYKTCLGWIKLPRENAKITRKREPHHILRMCRRI